MNPGPSGRRRRHSRKSQNVALEPVMERQTALVVRVPDGRDGESKGHHLGRLEPPGREPPSLLLLYGAGQQPASPTLLSATQRCTSSDQWDNSRPRLMDTILIDDGLINSSSPPYPER